MATTLNAKDIQEILLSLNPTQTPKQIRYWVLSILQQIVTIAPAALECVICELSGDECRCPSHGLATPEGWRYRRVHAWGQAASWRFKSDALVRLVTEDTQAFALVATLSAQRLSEVVTHLRSQE